MRMADARKAGTGHEHAATEPGQARPTRAPLGLLALLVCASLLPYVSALRNDFAFDDRPIITDNTAVTGFALGKIWTEPYWPPAYRMAALYRPVTLTTFAVDWAIGRGRPQAFIVVNLLLHLTVTLLVLRLLRRIFPRQDGVAWGAAFLFAVHPIHVEAVAGIVGRSELLAALCTLLGYSFWLEAEKKKDPGIRALLAPALWLIALLSKESAIALPAILLLHRIGRLEPASRRILRRGDVAWIAAAAVAILLRAHALGGLAVPSAPAVDNPLAPLSPWLRALGAGGVLARQIGQVAIARHFSADYSYAQVDPGASLYLAGGITLTILAGLILWASTRRRGRRPEGWGILFFSLTWIVTSNVIVPIGTGQADRLFYLPVLGIFVAVVGLATRLPALSRSRTTAVAILGVATIVYGARAAARTPQWRNDRTLFEAAARDAPRSVKARCNLATELLHAQTIDGARRALAVLDPVAREAAGYAPYTQAQAKARMFLGETESARDIFRRALRQGADSAEVLIELGNIAMEMEDGKEARACFDLVRRTGKRLDHAAIGHASALAIEGRYGEAADEWLPIVASLPDSVPPRAACAWNLTEAGRASEAVDLVQAGLSRRQDPRLYNSLARALIAAGRIEEARQAAEAAVGGDPSEANLATLALVQIARGDTREGRETQGRIHDPDLLQEIEEALSNGPRQGTGLVSPR